MSRKDYVKFAELFSDSKPAPTQAGYEWTMKLWRRNVERVADICAEDNHNFNRSRFYYACEYE